MDSMTHNSDHHPTQEQHRALLNDCWYLVHELPTSGVLDRGGRPYRAQRVAMKLQKLEDDPAGLLEYIRGMARRWSEGLDALVLYNRLDLSLETLILDESKSYAPLFTADDRAAARAKLQRQESQVDELVLAKQARIATIRSGLPADLEQLRALAAADGDPERSIAINTAILERMPDDVVALNRLGRAYEADGSNNEARSAFEKALEIDPSSTIAAGRLRRIA
jgi:tetratricopeptide (TPR) repeat protein